MFFLVRQNFVCNLDLLIINHTLNCLENEGTQVDKRLKKIPESAIGCTMIESGGLLGIHLLFENDQI